MTIPYVNFKDPVATRKFIDAAFAFDPKRLRHIQVIAEHVRESATYIQRKYSDNTIDADLAYCAALLHDVGYLPELRVTKFHPLDGAEFLRSRGFSDIAALIEVHSCSPEEAALSGVRAPEPCDDLIAKLISYWDMRVMQGGAVVTYAERLKDILTRYGEQSLVGRANLNAQSRLEEVFREVEGLLR